MLAGFPANIKLPSSHDAAGRSRAGGAGYGAQDIECLPSRGGKLAAGLDDEMGAAALFAIGDLPGKHCLQAVGVMPGRDSIRWRWIAAGAETTMIMSTRVSAPVSKRSGMSRRTMRRPAACAAAWNFSSACRTSGWIIASSRSIAGRSWSTRSRRRSRSTAPFKTVPGNAVSTSGAAAPR